MEPSTELMRVQGLGGGVFGLSRVMNGALKGLDEYMI